MRQLDQALGAVGRLKRERNQALAQLTATWEKTWFPRVLEANGRKFRHEHDDVKDHRGDRTLDLSYHILRQIILRFDEWTANLREMRNRFAKANNLPAREGKVDWKEVGAMP